MRRLFLLPLAIIGTACQSTPQSNPTTSRPTPLPQDAVVQVYFNQDQSATYREPYRQQERPGVDLEQKIVEAIAQSTTRIDVAVQEFRLPRIAEALIERHRAGVQVRVILENTYRRPLSRFTAAEIARLPQRERSRHQEFARLVDRDRNGHLSPQEIATRDALVMLEQAKIPLIDDTADGSAGSALMHHKFIVLDGQRVIVSSANFTPSDMHGDFLRPASRGNANNLLQIDSREVANLFTREFTLMWGDGPGGKLNSLFGIDKPYRPAQTFTFGQTQVTVQFSPTRQQLPWNQSSNGLISRTLAGASQGIDMALFVFSDQRLVDRLEPLHQKQVQIRTLIEPTFAYRSYSEALDMLGLEMGERSRTNPALCRIEAGNHPWHQPITTVGVPRLPRGDLLHHKFGLVDDRIVLTGSHNWTDAANLANDETLVVITSPVVAAHFRREFDRLYRGASLGIPAKLRQRIQTRQRECQTAAVKSTQRGRLRPDSTPSAGPITRASPDGAN